jgi:hypothetical protein
MTYAIISSDNKLIAAPIELQEIDNLPETTRNQYGWFDCAETNPDYNPETQTRILFQVTRKANKCMAHYRVIDNPIAAPWITVSEHETAKMAIISDFEAACEAIILGAATIEEALQSIQAGIDDVCQAYEWVDNPPEPEE